MNFTAQSGTISSKVQDSTGLLQAESTYSVVRRLENIRFPSFLLASQKTSEYFLLKFFPHVSQQASHYFKNESRISQLSHPNLISIIDSQEKGELKFDEDLLQGSYVIMDATPFGSLVELIKLSHLFQDEILIRTYFHQLISGIQYLHSNGVAHMNLKLSDLFIGWDCRLKIANFEDAYLTGDACISGGTKNHRAPEVIKEKCKDPQSADIYCAGLILFNLKFGHLPYLEDSTDKRGLVGHPMLQKYRAEPYNSEEAELLDLFLSMTNSDPIVRLTCEEIKHHKWFTKQVYSDKEVQRIVICHFQKNKTFESSKTIPTIIYQDGVE